MSANPIIMTVLFQALPGKEAELKQELTRLVEPTRKEDGCLFYDLHVNANDPSRLLFHESWTSQAHHAAHDRTAHIQAFRTRVGELSLPAVKNWWEKID